ncbi:hypothetical protein FQN57_007478 [Myotisia sp. PD_48]|nr:hypothetical protein FQN57_007478 [Myotisia sp. PD_48]
MSSVDKKLLVGLLPANDMAESGVPAGVTLESAVPPTGSPPPDAPTTAPVPGPPTSSPAPDAPTSCTAPPTPANEPRFKARYSVIKCCDCDDHGTKRYNQNGEADIKPCAYKCPFCTYQVANGGRHGSTIRKHIITCHVGQNKFKNMSVKQGTGRLGS